jgi:hypothetical protein
VNILKNTIFQGHLKKTSVSKKTPEVAPILHFNYQIKIAARICNPKKKLVLAGRRVMNINVIF